MNWLLILDLVESYLLNEGLVPLSAATFQNEVNQHRAVCRQWRQFFGARLTVAVSLSSSDKLSAKTLRNLIGNSAWVGPSLSSLTIHLDSDTTANQGWYSWRMQPAARRLNKEIQGIQDLIRNSPNLKQIDISITPDKPGSHPPNQTHVLNVRAKHQFILPASLYKVILSHCKNLECLWKGAMPPSLPPTIDSLLPDPKLSPSEKLRMLLPKLDRAEIKCDEAGWAHRQHYVPNVKHLVVVGPEESNYIFLHDPPSHLTELRSLELKSVPSSVGTSAWVHSPTAPFAKVTILKARLYNDDTMQLNGFLKLFPNIEELHLKTLAHRGDSLQEHVDVIKLRCLKLKKLSIRGPMLPEDLLHFEKLSNLQSLSVSYDWISTSASMRRLLSATPKFLEMSNLRELNIDLNEPGSLSPDLIMQQKWLPCTQKFIENVVAASTTDLLQGCPKLFSLNFDVHPTSITAYVPDFYYNFRFRVRTGHPPILLQENIMPC